MMGYRAYFKLKFTLESPLAIGDYESEKTDSDMILDSRDMPIIPATAIAGILRAQYDATKRCGNDLFGYVNKKEHAESRLVFYDAEITDNKPCSISVRDSVKLDKYKTAAKGAKFDFQVVEPGTVFIGYAEATDEASKGEFENLLPQKLSIGSKTTRGYGLVKLEYQLREFDLDNTDDLDNWLGFDMFAWDGDDAWKSGSADGNDGDIVIGLTLAQKRSGLSIRQYYTHPDEVDYGPLSLKDGSPVIPGTSWAGCFRQRIREFAPDEVENIFGFVREKTKAKQGQNQSPDQDLGQESEQRSAQKSRIRFGESVLEGCREKRLTRNAIDRFTNGTKEHALYEEKTVYGGQTELRIQIARDVGTKGLNALCAAIMDLHYGYLAVGGLTGVGRGLFEVNGITVDGTIVPAVDYDSLSKEVHKCLTQ
jgi:CRISPR/Cas system CSM-associated protein Csm3 (group 7 of RAMP superfamily)